MANEIANQALINSRLSASTSIGDSALCPTKKTIIDSWDKAQVLDSIYTYSDDSVCRIEDIIKGKDAVVIADFDSIVVKYSWNNGSGKDLDTATQIENGDPLIALKPIGCGLGANPLTVFINGSEYVCLQFGGDNTSAIGGDESVLIYFANIVNDENYDTQPDIIDVGLYAGWHGGHTDANGDITVEINAYKGGTIQLNGYIFENMGGELRVNSTKTIHCNNDAKCSTAPAEKQHIATVSYYKDNQNGVFVSLS